jgi:uncharacterized phage protein (TIGR02216 family)
MALGLGLLGLAPSAFWAMTPKELEAAMRGRVGVPHVTEPLSRAELAGLMDQFPDRKPALLWCRAGDRS